MEKVTGKNRNIVRLLSIIAVIVVVIGIGVMTKSQKSYIGNNILHFPYFGTSSNEGGKIIYPWSSNQPIYGMFLYRSLLLPNSDFNDVAPDLAKSYNVSEDGKTYTIVLEENNLWSDGINITVDDVIFSFETIMKVENVNPIYSVAYKNILGMKDYTDGTTSNIKGLEVDGNTIIINLENSYEPFLQALAQMAIIPKHMLEAEDVSTLHGNKFWNNPVVSGMYMFDELVINEEQGDNYYSLVHNEMYKGDICEIEEIRLHVNSSDKRLDYYSTSSTVEKITYGTSADYEGYKTSMMFYRYFIFNIGGKDGEYNEVMNDIRMRQAIMHALNRRGYLKGSYVDKNQTNTSNILGFDAETTGYYIEYDVNKSKELLEEVGYDFDRPFRIGHYYTDDATMAFLKDVTNNLKSVGITVELVQLNSNDETYNIRNYDMALKGLSAFDDSDWYNEYLSENIFMSNVYSWTGVFDEAVNNLYRSITPEEYNENLLVVQEIEKEYLYKIPLYTLEQNVYIHKERLSVPEDISFGNTWYRHDLKLEEWTIKKENTGSFSAFLN